MTESVQWVEIFSVTAVSCDSWPRTASDMIERMQLKMPDWLHQNDPPFQNKNLKKQHLWMKLNFIPSVHMHWSTWTPLASLIVPLRTIATKNDFKRRDAAKTSEQDSYYSLLHDIISSEAAAAFLCTTIPSIYSTVQCVSKANRGKKQFLHNVT